MSKLRIAVVALIAVLSALWGLSSAIRFTFTMIAMDTGISGLLFLALHIALLLTLVAFAYLKIHTKPPNSYAPILLVGSIVFLALTLIPGSTIGSIMFPSAVGMLVAALLLRG